MFLPQMEFLQFAQQTGNPQVYSNKYTMQNTPILTKFNACDRALSPQAEQAFLQEKTGQTLLINNNAQKNQLLGVSNEYMGSMQQYSPLMTIQEGQLQLIPVQNAKVNLQGVKQEKKNENLINMLFLILVVFIAINTFTFMKIQKLEYRLKYSQNAAKSA